MSAIDEIPINDPALDVFWNLADEQGRRSRVQAPADIPDGMTVIGLELRLWEMEPQGALFDPPTRVRIVETRELVWR